MIPTAFDEENGYLEPPEGMSIEECELLPVWRGRQPDGTPVVVSCFKPTRDELAEIQRTGRVWIMMMGYSQPPVVPLGFNPFVRRPDPASGESASGGGE